MQNKQITKELKKMSRRELLELLINQEKENEQLKAELKEAKDKLADRSLAVSRAGTLAEAALRLNGVFEAADAAVKQYVDNITQNNENQQADYDGIIADAKARAAEIIKEAELESSRKINAADNYWQQMVEKSKAFYQSIQGIKSFVDDPEKK